MEVDLLKSVTQPKDGIIIIHTIIIIGTVAAGHVFVLYYNHVFRRGFCRGHLGESVRETNQRCGSLFTGAAAKPLLFLNGKCSGAFLMSPAAPSLQRLSDNSLSPPVLAYSAKNPPKRPLLP